MESNANSESSSLSPVLTAEQARAIEAKIGRKLTPRERMFPDDGLVRPDDRTIEQRIVANSWKPYEKVEANMTGWSETILDLESKVAAETESANLAKMTALQRQLYYAQPRHQQVLKERTSAEAMSKHLANWKPQLDALRGLLDKMRWDPAYKFSEVEAVKRAIQQIEHGPNADSDVAKDMFASAMLVERQKQTERRAAVELQLAKLAEQKSQLDAAIADLDPALNAKAEVLAELDAEPPIEWKDWGIDAEVDKAVNELKASHNNRIAELRKQFGIPETAGANP